MFEFHISRFARDKYSFDRSIYRFTGNAILGDFAAARDFAHRMNRERDLIRYPEQSVRAAEINAMGLIDEILHAVIAEYRSTVNPGVFDRALDFVHETVGPEAVERTLRQFSGQFPPVAVYQGKLSVEDYLAGETSGISHRAISVEELLMLWLANANPAFRKFDELFEDRNLPEQVTYRKMMSAMDRFFAGEPGFGPKSTSILDLLRQPAREHPDSLFSQLAFLLDSYSAILSKYSSRLLRSLDFLREENKPGFTGPGPVEVVEFSQVSAQDEPEKYSPDSEWMPRLVLIAKNTYVWLDQLSRVYGREIRRLDQIPEAELQKLAGWGFSGLWLIGLWERSSASKTIKHLTGNIDAVASAYSLYDYQIAHDLGGDEAYAVLREKAAACGLRLAADMVPNHTGIYSKWVIERPDWFIYRDYPPFPSYSFNGHNLSPDPSVGIYLEDHYYARTDASVVFKRVDFNTGRTQYIYHGNDGTSMPWNDTAQINYLNGDAREAVIRTIVDVARKFPIIRFDAAMTLAKKHIQRLWFPEPGHGGAIPSRSENSLPRMRFDELMPIEFWREVVDRIAVEVPDTLLLAEAFWMMEGYFVRSLGMHRVYNSAFMNMLRDEKNVEYRQVIKNTIEFDPEILKRYVNFMNNPDEETAAEQFGEGGKYFGICVLMSTLPGLPMYGHGQVEGFKEKYGMEYQRAYYDETPNQGLISRHEHEIFPLLHQRALFAHVDHFRLYDLQTPSGVNEDVYAYSNRHGDKASLVLFHNRWGEVRGTIHHSCSYAVRNSDGSSYLSSSSIGEALGLPNDPARYVIFRDQITGLEYIRSCAEIHANGLQVHLGAFQYHVYLDFRVVEENEWSHYRMIMDYLLGRGVHNLEAVKQEVILQPVLQPWKELVNPGFFNWVVDVANTEEVDTEQYTDLISQTRDKVSALMTALSEFLEIEADPEMLTEDITEAFEKAVHVLPAESPPQDWAVLLSWIFSRQLGRLDGDVNYTARSRAWLDEWLFTKDIAGVMQAVSSDRLSYPLAMLLIEKDPSTWLKADAFETLRSWLRDGEAAAFLGINRHQGILWYDRAALHRLLEWVGFVNSMQVEPIANAESLLTEIRDASLIAGYQVNPLLSGLEAGSKD